MRSARLRNLLGLKSNSQNTSAMNLLTNPHQAQNNNDQYDLNDPITNLINENKQLLQRVTGNDLSLKHRNNVNFNAQQNGGLNMNDVQKMLQMNETDAQSMLMMSNLMNQIDTAKNSKKNNGDEDEVNNFTTSEAQSKVSHHPFLTKFYGKLNQLTTFN